MTGTKSTEVIVCGHRCLAGSPAERHLRVAETHQSLGLSKAVRGESTSSSWFCMSRCIVRASECIGYIEPVDPFRGPLRVTKTALKGLRDGTLPLRLPRWVVLNRVGPLRERTPHLDLRSAVRLVGEQLQRELEQQQRLADQHGSASTLLSQDP